MRFTVLIAIFGILTGITGIFGNFGVSEDGLQSGVEEFGAFIEKFGAGYETIEEYDFRMKVFQKNLERYEKLREEQPLTQFGVTRYSDRTEEELEAIFGYQDSGKDYPDLNKVVQEINEEDLPESISWHDFINIQRENPTCGHWAIQAATIVGTRYALKTGTSSMLALSAQQLIDCDFKNQGCSPGSSILAMEFWTYNPIATDAQYPYISTQGQCNPITSSLPQITDIILTRHGLKGVFEALSHGPVLLPDLSGYTGGVVTE